jgi:drug/metabolite transporter (DMT)-like permease
MYQAQLRWQPVALLLLLALIWGANMAIIKIGARELAPLFMAGVRSLVASGCLYIWIKAKGMNLFPSTSVLLHGVVIGLLFGSEFGFIYLGLQYTLASRTYVLVYTAPFFVALGAHFFLKGDRLNGWKVLGLILAFAGVVSLFVRDLGSFSVSILPGDLMALAGGALWGATTVYLKKYLSYRVLPLQTLFRSAVIPYELCPGRSHHFGVFFCDRFLRVLSVYYRRLYQLSRLVRAHPPVSGESSSCLFLFYASLRCVVERSPDTG